MHVMTLGAGDTGESLSYIHVVHGATNSYLNPYDRTKNY